MTEIPDDVMKAAYDAALDYRNDKACDPIHNDDALQLAFARAILAERERCAKAMGKPVAWVYENDLKEGDGSFGRAKGEVFMSRHGYWVNLDTPLYAAPQITVDM